MLHFNLVRPASLVWFGEFISPEHGWKHLTRQLYEYELMMLTEGTLYIADEKEEYAVSAGEYLIMSPTRRQHGTRICRCRFYWLHFQCPALPASISLPAQAKIPDPKRIGEIANCLFYAEQREHRGIASHYLASQLLIELAAGNAVARAREALTPKEQLCARIREYVAWHRFSDIRIADIARELGYHEKYLSAIFHETTGQPLKRFLIQTRLTEAERLLSDTDYTVTEVAYYLNFQNPNNFSRFFRSERGMTPQEYRKSQRSRDRAIALAQSPISQ